MKRVAPLTWLWEDDDSESLVHRVTQKSQVALNIYAFNVACRERADVSKSLAFRLKTDREPRPLCPACFWVCPFCEFRVSGVCDESA